MKAAWIFFLAVLATAGFASAQPQYFQVKTGSSGGSVSSWTTPALDTKPTNGDTLILAISYGVNNCSVNTPAGWTKVGDANWGSTYYIGQTLFTKVANTDTGAVPITSSAGCSMGSTEEDITGGGAVDGFAAKTENTGAITDLTSGTPTTSGALPVAIFATRSSVASFSNPGGTQDAIQNLGPPYQEAQHYAVTSSAQTASVTFYSTGYQVGEIVLVESPASVTIKALSSTHAGGPHQSIAISQQSSFPALAPWESYFGTATSDAMVHISPSNLTKWGNDCQGYSTTTAQTGGDSGGANILQCSHPYFYTNFGFMEPNTSGNTSVLPWTGNLTGTSCPSVYKSSGFAKQTGTDAPDWSSNGSNNWGMYEGTIGSDANRIGGYYSGSLYSIFLNLNSATLVSSVNDALHGCSYEGYALDGYEGFWNDNGYIGLASANWVPWWGGGLYNQNINWGAPNGTPYVSFTCGGGLASSPSAFFGGGSYCSTSSQIDSKTISQGNTTYGPDTGSGLNLKSTYTAAFESFVSKITHASGSKMKTQINDAVNGYMVCQMLNYEPNVTAAIREGATSRGWGDGRIQADATLQDIIDVASEDYACGGGTYMIHDYLTGGDNAEYYNGTSLVSVTGAGKYGTPQSLLDIREHVYMMWLLSNDTYPKMIGSFTHACNASGSCGTTYPSWTDVWSWNFAAPSGRTTTYPSQALSSNGQYCSTASQYSYEGTGQACNSGGSHDSRICATGTVPNCVFIANFSHFYVWNYTACASGPDQTQWNNTSGCVKDIGPFTVLYNLSGSTQTLSSANLSAWIGSQYGSLNYMLWPGCVPSSSAYSTTAGQPVYVGDAPAGSSAPSTSIVCSSGVGDVYNGGRMGSVALSSILGTTLLDGEAIGFTAAAP